MNARRRQPRGRCAPDVVAGLLEETIPQVYANHGEAMDPADPDFVQLRVVSNEMHNSSIMKFYKLP